MKKGDLETGRSEDSEQSSLLGKAKDVSITTATAIGDLTASAASPLTSMRMTSPRIELPFTPDNVVIKYDPVKLTGLSTLTLVEGTIFTQWAMWYVLIIAFGTTGIIAFAIVRLIDHYDHINPQDFSTQTISSVISSVSVAMAFLLGLYINNAMARWWDIIKQFERLFGSTKKLIQLLVHLDAPASVREEAAKRCVLSIECLRFEKIVEKLGGEAKSHWAEKFDALMTDSMMTIEERRALEQVDEHERSVFCWGLVAKTLKQLQPKLGNMYRDVFRLVQEGTAAVSGIKSTAAFQFPYLYVHMLAWLVHLVNLLTAVCAGITIGIVIARARMSSKDKDGNREPVDASSIFKECLFLFIQVFLYQAFLGIGAALSFPVVPRGHGAMYRLPLQEMILALRKTLHSMNKLADDKVL